MANKNIVIPEPIATTPGVTITLTRLPTGNVSVAVGYVATVGGITNQDGTSYTEAEYIAAPAGFKSAVEALFTALVPNARPRMGY